MHTTLNKILALKPCEDGWRNLLRSLNKFGADDDELNIACVLDSNGLDDALWRLPAVDGFERDLRLFAIWCAHRALELHPEQRSQDSLAAARRFADGLASEEELTRARDVAWTASIDAQAFAAPGEHTKWYAAESARLAIWHAPSRPWLSAAGAARAALATAATTSDREGEEMRRKIATKLRELCRENPSTRNTVQAG